MLFLDAIDAGRPVGTLVVLERERIAPALRPQALAPPDRPAGGAGPGRAAGTLPSELVAIGLQPGRVEMGSGLSPELECRLDDAPRPAVERLERWGVRLRPADPAPDCLLGVTMTTQLPTPCPSCGTPGAETFCSNCGAPRAGAPCRACGAALSPRARFCSSLWPGRELVRQSAVARSSPVAHRRRRAGWACWRRFSSGSPGSRPGSRPPNPRRG